MIQFCTIHLAFDRGCFEAVLIEITLRTLEVKWLLGKSEKIYFISTFKFFNIYQ
jgi:hypothetical protein